MPNPTKRKLRKLLRLKRTQAAAAPPVVEEVETPKVEESAVEEVKTPKVKTVKKTVKTDD